MFDVIVGTHTLAGWAVQIGDHFVALVGRQHSQGLGQIGIGQEFRRLDQDRTPTAGLMRALVRIEQTINLPQGPQRRQILKHQAEPAPFATVEVLGTGDDQVPMFPDEVGLFFRGFAVAGVGTRLTEPYSADHGGVWFADSGVAGGGARRREHAR